MVRIRSRNGSVLPRRRVPGAGCPEIDSALSGAFVRAEMAAFRLTGRGTAPVLYRRANGWGDKSCLCCDVCRFWLASNFTDAFLFSPSFDCEFHVLYPVLCGVCRCMRILPCYAAVLIWPVSISSCVVRPLSVVCISPSCCAAVISMLGSRTALCCAADFVCCLCTAAAACAFDPRVPVLPVLRFLLSYGCCLNRIRYCAGLPWPLSLLRPMAAQRFPYAVLRGAYGGGFLAVWFGVGNARMRLGGAVLCLDSARSPLFSLFSSLFAFFYPHVLFFRRRPLRSPLRAASFSPFSLLFPSHSFLSSLLIIFARFSWRTAFFR